MQWRFVFQFDNIVRVFRREDIVAVFLQRLSHQSHRYTAGPNKVALFLVPDPKWENVLMMQYM